MNRQQQAINDYLQALLHDVDDEPEPAALAEVPPPAMGLERLVAEVPEVISETESRTEVVTEVALQQPVATPEVADSVAVSATPQAAVSPIPEWAEYAFQCLLFKVSGLTLAVPLVKLNSVIPWTEKIVETPNKTDWYLGLVNNHGKNVKVIDTALMVLPENRRHLLVDAAEQRSSHILLVDDYNWGLACDEIGDDQLVCLNF